MIRIPSALLAGALTTACGVVGAVVADRCARADDPRAPIAPPGGGAASNLDEWLANVAGETITRRMLVRAMDERGPDESEALYERKLHERLIGRVINGVVLWKAKQMGLDLRAAIIDDEVEKAAKAEVENARERGVVLTFEQILARRGQSREEYHDLVRRELLVGEYWAILVRGVPGKRPQVDIEPSPAESLALYRKHAKAFHLPRGVRISSFVARPESFLATSGGGYDAAIDAARAHVRGLAADVAAGRRPEDVARMRGVAKADWAVTPGDDYVEKGKLNVEMADAWLFDPARRVGDVTVVEDGRGTLAGLTVLSIRPARERAYGEVLPDLLARIRAVRMGRFRYAHILEALSVAPVKPPALVEQIAEQFRIAQKRLDDDPVNRDIRLR